MAPSSAEEGAVVYQGEGQSIARLSRAIANVALASIAPASVGGVFACTGRFARARGEAIASGRLLAAALASCARAVLAVAIRATAVHALARLRRSFVGRRRIGRGP